MVLKIVFYCIVSRHDQRYCKEIGTNDRSQSAVFQRGAAGTYTSNKHRRCRRKAFSSKTAKSSTCAESKLPPTEAIIVLIFIVFDTLDGRQQLAVHLELTAL